MQKFESKELWNFEIVNPNNPYFQYKFTKRLSKHEKPKGAGIYVWIANLNDGTSKVCYTGSYKNSKNNNKVYDDRWHPHIHSKTHRGGFGKAFGFGSKKKWVERFLPLYKKYGFNTDVKIFEQRFTSSGSQASVNRCEFSLKHWNLLNMENPFTIYWFPSELDAKEIDHRELTQINPVVNGEINEEYNSEKQTMNINDTIEHIKKVLA